MLPSSSRSAGCSSGCARGTWSHLVLLRFLGRWNHLHRPAFRRDFFRRRLGEVMGPDHEPLRELTVPQNAYAVDSAFGKPNTPQCFVVNGITVGKSLVQVAHVDDVKVLVPGSMAKAA